VCGSTPQRDLGPRARRPRRGGRQRRPAGDAPAPERAGRGAEPSGPQRATGAVGCLDALGLVLGRPNHGSAQGSQGSRSLPTAGASAAASGVARVGGQLQRKTANLLGDFWEGQRKWQKHSSVRAMVMEAGPGAIRNHGDAEWLDHLARECWPRVQKYVETLVSETIEPLINRLLPNVLKGSVRFSRVNLGNATPKFGPLEVISSPKVGTIECRCGMRLETSDLHVGLTAMGLPLGISKITLDGRISVVFRPPLARPPFFGGLEVYMVNAPDLDIEFRGAAQIAQSASVRPAVRTAIRQVISRVMVLPNRIAVDLDDSDDVDIADLKCPDPVGVLRLTVLRAENLLAADFALPGAEASSDPYVVVKVGAHCWSTSVVRQNLNPAWGHDGAGETHDFLVHDPAQELSVEVFDQDMMSSDDIISAATRDPALPPGGPGWPRRRRRARAGRGGRGASARQALRRGELAGPPAAALRLLRPALPRDPVQEVRGLPSDALFPFRVEASVQGSKAATRIENSFANRARGAARPLRELCLEKLRGGEGVPAVCQSLGLTRSR
ncbi:unnamed protein product, partial [Prorocentrum cordatum]